MGRIKVRAQITEIKGLVKDEVCMGTYGLVELELRELVRLVETTKPVNVGLGGIIKPLPSKKELMEFANNYTKNEMPEFNEQDKIIFRAGVLNCHRWIEENKIG